MLKAKRTSVRELKDEIAESAASIKKLSKRKAPAKDAPAYAYQKHCRSLEHEWNQLRMREEAIAKFTKTPDPKTPRPTVCPTPMTFKFWNKSPPKRPDADEEFAWGLGPKPPGYDDRAREYATFKAGSDAEYAEYKARGLWGTDRGTKCVSVKAPLASFDRRSIRTITRGLTRILIGCPKGQWMPRRQRCKVGTRAYEVITPTVRGRCRRGAKKRS